MDRKREREKKKKRIKKDNFSNKMATIMEKFARVVSPLQFDQTEYA
jgi:hypothetical protein